MNREHTAGILFDLFDTLVEVDPARLPTLIIDGKGYPSTIPAVCQAVISRYPAIEMNEALVELFRLLANRPKSLLREHSSRRLFENFLARLNVPVNAERDECANYLSDMQMRLTTDAVSARSGACELVRTLREQGIRLALVSNLDHARAAPWLLESIGLADCFDCLILSEDLGVKKPHRRMFETALASLSLTPDRVTHVGDDELADVHGAGRLGIQTVWVNPSGRPATRTQFPPALVVSSLTELLPYFN
jgi:HAD superfamily hydrolase (TIGR01509 family)